MDWYREGPYERMSYRFYWSINNGIINLTYPGYPEYNTSIRDYRMTGSRFTGYFINGTEPFYLDKIANYYNWSDYYSWDYHYWYYDTWDWDYYPYYTKTRSTAAPDNGSADTPTTEDRIVKIGSHLAEQ